MPGERSGERPGVDKESRLYRPIRLSSQDFLLTRFPFWLAVESMHHAF